MKLPSNPFKAKGAQITTEERLAAKQKDSTIARLGLKPEDSDGAVTDKRPPPPKDTRKKTIKQIKVQPAGAGGGLVAPPSPTKKKRKKKKLKLDPKGEYAKMKAEEEAALSKEEENEETTIEAEDDEWHDCVRCFEVSSLFPFAQTKPSLPILTRDLTHPSSRSCAPSLEIRVSTSATPVTGTCIRR